MFDRSLILRSLHIFNHGALIYGIWLYGPQWLLLSFFCWFFFGCLGISIGFHRLLSHRAFEASPLGYYLCSFLGCLATGGSPLSWVGAHRLHHTHPDQPGDPHSIVQDGWLSIYFHLWKPFAIQRKHIRDLLKDPYQKFLHRYYFHILLIYAGSLFYLSPVAGIFAYSGPAVLAFHAFGLINTFGHSHGYRSFTTQDQSTNSWVANLLTWGEGWHNNHHKYPASYRIGLKSNEWDISAWVLERVPLITSSRFRQRIKLRQGQGL